jgi:hypothetical protein
MARARRQRHRVGGQAMHDAITIQGGGWTSLLERFAKAATDQE